MDVVISNCESTDVKEVRRRSKKEDISDTLGFLQSQCSLQKNNKRWII